MPISRVPATQIVFNATGQQHRRTTPFTYLGGAVTETPNLSDEIDRSFRRYTRELYDRPTAGPEGSDREIRGSRDSSIRMRYMDPSEGPLYQAPYNTPQDAASNPKNPGAGRRTNASSPTKTPSSEPNVRASKQPCARGRGGWGRCSAQATTGYPRGPCREIWRTREKVSRRGREMMDGQRG